MKYIFIIYRHNGKIDKYKISQSELDFFTEFANLNKIKTLYAFYILKAKHQYSNITICYYEEKLRLLGKLKIGYKRRVIKNDYFNNISRILRGE